MPSKKYLQEKIFYKNHLIVSYVEVLVEDWEDTSTSSEIFNGVQFFLEGGELPCRYDTFCVYSSYHSAVASSLKAVHRKSYKNVESMWYSLDMFIFNFKELFW